MSVENEETDERKTAIRLCKTSKYREKLLLDCVKLVIYIYILIIIIY